jgi:hypothetical protein
MMKKADIEVERAINLERAKTVIAELKKDIGFIENAIVKHGVYPYWMRDMEERVASLRALAVVDNTLSSIQNKRYFKKKKDH